MPGDYLRRQIQDEIVYGLETGLWSNTQRKFEEIESNAALIVGDASGPKIKMSKGWISPEDEISIASQSKEVAALTIHRLIKRYPALLSLDTKVNQHIESWPKGDQPGANVTLRHLMAFTTGWKGLHFHKPGCARMPGKIQPSWEECLKELSQQEFGYEPGTMFQYGPWHLLVAAGVAHLAVGRALTYDDWIDTVRKEVFEPVGITEAPKYDVVDADAPIVLGQRAVPYTGLIFGPFPLTGKFRSTVRNRIPDFSGGMRMTGWEWQRIVHALQFGGLLNPAEFEAFIADQTMNVTRWEPMTEHDSGFANLDYGMWHYTQGEWAACDVAVEKGLDPTAAETIALCSGSTPVIRHSCGAYGEYIWMDLTNNYWGVYHRSWMIDLVHYYWIGTTLSCVLAFCCGPACGAGLWAMRYKNKGNSSDSDSMEESEMRILQDESESDY